MTGVYVGIGHGLEPNGVLDTGATGADGTLEHDLNAIVCQHVDAGLTRSGVHHHTEQNSGNSHDPDYRGSVEAVNSGHYDAAVEVHFDSAAAPRGGFGIFESDDGIRLAGHIAARWHACGLPARPSYLDNRGLWFLKGTDCPAVIWECDPTGAHDPTTLAVMGEAIAAGICDFMGVDYVSRRINPMFDPPLPVAAWRLFAAPTPFLIAVGPDGAIFAEPADEYRGGANGKAYFANRIAAAVDEPNAEELAANKVYVIVDTVGERYAYPE